MLPKDLITILTSNGKMKEGEFEKSILDESSVIDKD